MDRSRFRNHQACPRRPRPLRLAVRPYSLSLTIHSMPDQHSPEIELLRAAYAAFNARDIDAALTLMTADVAWPRAFNADFREGESD
jgi:DNA-binding GntR family transcriptional regulator